MYEKQIKLAEGGDFQEAQILKQVAKKLEYVEVKPKTDSFIKIASDIPWYWIAGGVVCLVIGALVVTILLLKLTPLGKMVSKAWNGLRAMFKALIAWKPKSGK